jgi:hypothetical protein
MQEHQSSDQSGPPAFLEAVKRKHREYPNVLFGFSVAASPEEYQNKDKDRR